MKGIYKTRAYNIYGLRSHILNSIIYIGVSTKLEARLKSHLYFIGRGKHPNRFLQMHVEFFGSEDLILIKYMTVGLRSIALSIESHLIEELNTYNIKIGKLGDWRKPMAIAEIKKFKKLQNKQVIA